MIIFPCIRWDDKIYQTSKKKSNRQTTQKKNNLRTTKIKRDIWKIMNHATQCHRKQYMTDAKLNFYHLLYHDIQIQCSRSLFQTSKKRRI
jgi:hypothetical protein